MLALHAGELAARLLVELGGGDLLAADLGDHVGVGLGAAGGGGAGDEHERADQQTMTVLHGTPGRGG
ncbi:MAG: hypothetical protein QM767_06215 [Anaeromyxobacter sp.]